MSTQGKRCVHRYISYLDTQLRSEAQLTSHLSLYGQLMSADEFRKQGQVHTQAALADLRKYLSTPEGKTKLNLVSDRQVAAECAATKIRMIDLFVLCRHRSETRHHVADLQSQFVRGTFGGVPSARVGRTDIDLLQEDVDDDSARKGRRSTWTQAKSCLTFVTICFILAVVVSIVLAVVM